MGTWDTRLDILGGVGKRVGHGENCKEMSMTSDFCQKILEDDQQQATGNFLSVRTRSKVMGRKDSQKHRHVYVCICETSGSDASVILS